MPFSLDRPNWSKIPNLLRILDSRSGIRLCECSVTAMRNWICKVTTHTTLPFRLPLPPAPCSRLFSSFFCPLVSPLYSLAFKAADVYLLIHPCLVSGGNALTSGKRERRSSSCLLEFKSEESPFLSLPLIIPSSRLG